MPSPGRRKVAQRGRIDHVLEQIEGLIPHADALGPGGGRDEVTPFALDEERLKEVRPQWKALGVQEEEPARPEKLNPQVDVDLETIAEFELQIANS